MSEEIKAGDAWKNYIKQYQKLEEAWLSIHEPANIWLSQQIDIFAGKYPVKAEPVKPSLQSGVEEAAKKYVEQFGIKDQPVKSDVLKWQAKIHFKAGAEWQAQQAKPAIPWVSIKDSLPKDHTYVIGYYWNGRDIYEFKHGCFFIGLDQNKEVTHWMPLPEPPIQ